MPTKVLVLDPDSAAALETIQSLGRRGCIVHTASLLTGATGRHSRYVCKHTELSDGGIAQLVAMFYAENYDLLVPSTEVSLLALLSPHIPDEMYRRAVLPARASVEAALDKERVWMLAQRLGVRVPQSELVSVDSVPPNTFPVVLKPVFSKQQTAGTIREFTVTIARNLDQWRTALASTYAGIPVQQQEYIAGKGVGVEMLFERGAMRWAFMHERVHELPLTGGGSSYRTSVGLRDDLVASARSLLAELQWHGAAMVEFKVTPSGEAYLMEINPRLWGSLALAIDCGVDFPAGLLALATGQVVPPQPHYKSGYFTRNIYRDVEWFKTNLKANRSDPLLLTRPVGRCVLEWLRPLAGNESWDFFSWSDPGPSFREVKTIVREHWLRLVRVVKRRWRRVYLQHVQQPRVVRKLLGHRIDHVLVLCYGNICRSPLAAALITKRFPNVEVASAGFYPEAGRSSPDFIVAEGSNLGLDLAGHRSARVHAEMIDKAQLVLIMDMRNFELMEKSFPHALEKTLLLGMLLAKPALEIKDPYDEPASAAGVALKINDAVGRIGSIFQGAEKG
jgi:protein-tyrosine-phosphatase/predicted ATP-grasp superfamily ATP-dependent carboligase